MAVFLKSRYDILLNRPGVEILNKDTFRRFIWGDRGSGRTSYLMHDMRTQISQGKTALFVTGSMEMVREIRRRCLEDSARHSISFPERLITFTSYKSCAWRGSQYNCR